MFSWLVQNASGVIAAARFSMIQNDNYFAFDQASRKLNYSSFDCALFLNSETDTVAEYQKESRGDAGGTNIAEDYTIQYGCKPSTSSNSFCSWRERLRLLSNRPTKCSINRLLWTYKKYVGLPVVHIQLTPWGFCYTATCPSQSFLFQQLIDLCINNFS